jgi:hypothetical protein
MLAACYCYTSCGIDRKFGLSIIDAEGPMYPSLRAFAGFCLFLLLTSPAIAGGMQTQPKPPLPELWTTLQTKFDSQKLQVGDVISARASQSWVYLTCGVSEGVILHGRVISKSEWSESFKSTILAVRFEAPCENGVKAPLVLIAVFYALDPEKGQMETYMSMPQGIGPGASGRQSTPLNTLPSPGADGQQNLPLAKLGEVKRIGHLTLGVGKGAQGSTTLVSTDKRLRLEPGTRLAFVPVPQMD